MRRLFHGGALNEPGPRLWATEDFDYAAAFAQLYEANVWEITLMLDEAAILDVTSCGLDAVAVADVLTTVGIPASADGIDTQDPHVVVRNVSMEAVRAAGYRAIRLCESIDWGGGERRAVSYCLIDATSSAGRDTNCAIETFRYRANDDGHSTSGHSAQ